MLTTSFCSYPEPIPDETAVPKWASLDVIVCRYLRSSTGALLIWTVQSNSNFDINAVPLNRLLLKVCNSS